MSKPLSKHRHISFTAHYTGYIWYQMGISHPEFATKKGKMLAAVAHPVETWAEKYVGGSMRTTLKQRHQIIDEILEKLIAQHPDLQVLEIASGLSPRGWAFRQKYPQIDYRELDLPDMAAIKTQALQQLQADSPQVLSADLFSEDFQNAFAVFDPSRPLVIVSEGLINYFNQAHIQQLLKNIVNCGAAFKTLHYLTDLYPEPTQNKLANIIWSSSKLLKVISRSAFSFHFTMPEHVKHFVQAAGFKSVQILQPTHYFQNGEQITATDATHTRTSQEDSQHLGDLVWVIHATQNAIT